MSTPPTGRRSLVRASLLAWACSGGVLVVSAAGLVSVASTSTTTSGARMAVAAGVLALVSSAAGVVVVSGDLRSRRRCWLWSTTVPGLFGLGTGLLVGLRTDLLGGLVAALPWAVGAVVGALLAPVLPDLSLASWRHQRSARPTSWIH